MPKYGCWWRCVRNNFYYCVRTNFDNTTTTIPTYSIIKVQNFDNTATTIPIYSIINEYFKNWRNKNLSGGGRIKRFANIGI